MSTVKSCVHMSPVPFAVTCDPCMQNKFWFCCTAFLDLYCYWCTVEFGVLDFDKLWRLVDRYVPGRHFVEQHVPSLANTYSPGGFLYIRSLPSRQAWLFAWPLFVRLFDSVSFKRSTSVNFIPSLPFHPSTQLWVKVSSHTDLLARPCHFEFPTPRFVEPIIGIRWHFATIKED